VSVVVRKFPTLVLLLAVWYSFHLVRFRKSVASGLVVFGCGTLSDSPTAITLHGFVAGDHSVNCGHISHPSGMRSGTVRSICASLCLVQSHISFTSPQAIMRCSSVSFLSQFLHLSVGVSRILWSRSFVGIMSWITLNHAALLDAGTGVSCRFYHTTFQFACGHNLTMRIS